MDEQKPYTKCAFCGMGVTCEHSKCEVCQRCRPCERENRIACELNSELLRMSKEEPGW